MNSLAKFIVERSWLGWALAVVIAIAAGGFTASQMRELRERERLAHLETETERRGIEIMSQTLNGNLMGAVAVLGLIDDAIKLEALGQLPANSPKVLPTLESIGRSYDAEGVFLVNDEGIVASSWDNAGKPSTMLNVKFRPYYQMAMQGMGNVYAAVSIARGDRALYFASPVFRENTSGTEAIGAVVARTSLLKVDELLRERGDIALLLSPQGVVFASNRTEWIGRLVGAPTPERLKAIRALKQFGNMFEGKEPQILPFAVEHGRLEHDGRRYVLATAKVQWNDPFGDWRLVMLEDLDRTVSSTESRVAGGLSATLLLLIGTLGFVMLKGHHRQVESTRRIQSYAHAQEASAALKSRLAAATVRLQRAGDVAELARVFLEEAHGMFAVLQGVVYLLDSEREATLRLVGSYACAEAPPASLAFGEGLLGQCASERRGQLLAVSPEGFATIRSGLGDARPAAVVLLPVLKNEKLLGVVEVALLRMPEAADSAGLEELVSLLGMNIEIVDRSAQTEAMLAATLAAEKAGAAQLLFQQALLDTIPYPVFYKGADTRFLGFNHSYEACFGVRREALIGKRVLELEYLPHADRLAYQAEDEAIIAAIGKVEREMRIPFADGKLHDTIYFVSGFADAQGQPAGLIGTFIDVSEMKRAQGELERLADAERFNRLAQERETRILDLKGEINDLCARLGETSRYASGETTRGAAEGDHGAGEVGEGLQLVRLNWHPGYECGQAEIDRDHRALFAVANDLLNAIVAGKATEEIERIVGILVAEVTAHFAREEALLVGVGYEAVQEHAAIHQALMEKASALIAEFKAGKLAAGPFFQFLAYDVVARHMLKEDRKFFPLFGWTATHGEVAAVASAVPPLAELVDLEELQTLFSAFCESVGIAAAIIDLQGKVLASSRWQRACTDFHRVNADSCARCIESDTELALKLEEGRDFTMYRCKNGMTDCASPIIIEGQHLANVFIGQFHLGPPDIDFFRDQARRFGYDEEAYIAAIKAAPVADERRLPTILGFLSGFARMVSSMSLARLRADAAQRRVAEQSEILRRERLAALSLAEDAERARQALASVAKETRS